MFDILFQGGKVVTAEGVFEADVAVTGEKIACIGKIDASAASKVADVTGKLVLPGAIDAHTHLAMPFGGTVSADDYKVGTRAAVCGGVTTVFDYVMQKKYGDKVDGIMESVEKRMAMCAPVAASDYAFHVAITNLDDGRLLSEFPVAAEAGITSFKCFMVYRRENMMIDDGNILTVLEEAKKAGILVNVHAENCDVIDAKVAQFKREGKLSPWYHYLSRPEFVEEEADRRAIYWAEYTGAPLYIVHLANAGGVEAVREAKARGVKIYAETCPQYLEFTCDVYKREDGRNFVCSPPMKGEASREALWKAISDGFIDTVATDHCPFMQAEKDWGKEDFTKIPNGCAGIENLYPYMLDAAGKGKITYERAVELCATNPAKIFGCTRKGAIAVGKDADLVVYDPEKDFTISVANMHSDYDHTIWEGKQLHGYPVQTWLRGKLVYDNGEYVGSYGEGKFVKRAKHL